MDARKLAKLRKDLTAFLDAVVGTLGNARRRRWCETYVRGVLLDGQRKSIEPMATRLQGIESGAEDYEQALQQFVNQSPWDERTVLDGLQRWIGRQFSAEGYLILDDTGFPKQGKHSVGVARQYTGTLGKVASCQVATVTLQMASAYSILYYHSNPLPSFPHFTTIILYHFPLATLATFPQPFHSPVRNN